MFFFDKTAALVFCGFSHSLQENAELIFLLEYLFFECEEFRFLDFYSFRRKKRVTEADWQKLLVEIGKKISFQTNLHQRILNEFREGKFGKITLDTTIPD